VGRLLLIRHAESEGNRDQVFTATPFVPLTELGRDQARTAARWIQGRHELHDVVSSPFTRARETAAIVAETLRVWGTTGSAIGHGGPRAGKP